MKFFMHDVLAFDDDKIFQLVEKHGMGGYGFYWRIIECLYQQDDNGFQVEATDMWIKRLARSCSMSDYLTIVRYLDSFAELGLINAQLWAERVIFSDAVQKRGDKYIQEKIAGAERKRAARELAKLKKQNVSPDDQVVLQDKRDVSAESRETFLMSLEKAASYPDPYPDPNPDLKKELINKRDMPLSEENSFFESEQEPPSKPIKPTKQPAAERYEQFRLVYNANKPKNFAGADAVNPARQKKIAAEFKTHGDRTIEVLEKALKYANHERSWFQTKPVIAFKLDSFLTMGITGFAEQWDHFAGPGAEEAATDSDRLALYEKLYAQGDAEALLRPIDPNKEPEEYKRRFAFYQRKGEEAVRAARLRA